MLDICDDTISSISCAGNYCQGIYPSWLPLVLCLATKETSKYCYLPVFTGAMGSLIPK